MGKRQIGEVQLPEFVAAVLLSEVSALPITDSSIPVAHGLIPVLTIASLEIITSFLCRKSPVARKILDGLPIVLIEKGKVLEGNLTKARVSLDEIFAQIRIDGYKDISEVEYVVLEQTGKISILPKAANQPPTAEDLKIKVDETGMGHTVIIDGHIHKDAQKASGKSITQIESILRKHGIKNNSDVLYMTIDDKGNINIAAKKGE